MTIVIGMTEQGRAKNRIEIIKKGEQAMKTTLTKKMETLFAAAAFAEAGEFDTARQIMSEKEDLRKSDRPSTYDTKRPSTRPTMRAD